MLDRRHTRAHGRLYPLGTMRVRGHHPLQLGRLLHHDAQLLGRVLLHADRVALR